jgi:hypothetical protein
MNVQPFRAAGAQLGLERAWREKNPTFAHLGICNTPPVQPSLESYEPLCNEDL